MLCQNLLRAALLHTIPIIATLFVMLDSVLWLRKIWHHFCLVLFPIFIVKHPKCRAPLAVILLNSIKVYFIELR